MRAVELEGRDCRLRFHDLDGAGVPLLFVHGLGCAGSYDYPAVAASPALADRRRLLVDLLGSGFSDRPPDFPYTVDAHADTLRALIDALSLTSVDVYGHSMGGAAAIALAALPGDRVRRLVLSEPNLEPGGGTCSRAIARYGEEEYAERGQRRIAQEAARAGDRVWAACLERSFPRAMHRAAVSLVEGSDPTWRELLVGLRMPRTVIFGARSLPDPDAERLKDLGVAVRVVPDCGHAMAWENPAGLAAAIRASLV